MENINHNAARLSLDIDITCEHCGERSCISIKDASDDEIFERFHGLCVGRKCKKCERLVSVELRDLMLQYRFAVNRQTINQTVEACQFALATSVAVLANLHGPQSGTGVEEVCKIIAGKLDSHSEETGIEKPVYAAALSGFANGLRTIGEK